MKYRSLAVMLVLIIVSFVTEVNAVTYRNNGSVPILLINTSGSTVLVQPGDTIETYFYNTSSYLTKTSDTPYYNRVLDRDHVTATSEGVNVSINLNTDWIIVEKITGTIDVFIQSASNTPPEYDDRTSDDYIIQIPAKGKFNNIVITGSGNCDVVQYLEIK